MAMWNVAYFFIQKLCSEKVSFQGKLTVVGFFPPLKPQLLGGLALLRVQPPAGRAHTAGASIVSYAPETA